MNRLGSAYKRLRLLLLVVLPVVVAQLLRRVPHVLEQAALALEQRGC